MPQPTPDVVRQYAVRAGSSILGNPNSVLVDTANAELPFSQSSQQVILDIGSGQGGTLTTLFARHASSIGPDTKIYASDSSKDMLAMLNEFKEKAKSAKSKGTKLEQNAELWSQVEILELDIMDMSQIPDGSVSHVLAGLVLFAIPDPQQGLREIRRVLKDDGILALSSWETTDWQMLMPLFQRVKPETKILTLPEIWKSSEGVQQELSKAGYRGTKTTIADAEMPLDDYELFLRFTFSWPAVKNITKDWSDEEVGQLMKVGIEELKKKWPQLPGTMRGTAIVGVARQPL